MVTPQDDDSVFAESEAVELVEQLADLRIHVADGGVIAVLELAGEVIGNRLNRNTVIASHFIGVVPNRVFRSVFWIEIVRCEFDRGRIIEVPVFFRRNKREMRLDESHREEKRLIFLTHVTQRGHRKLGDFSVLEGVVRHVRRLECRAARVVFAGRKPFGS